MSVPISEQKALAITSGNLCAFPDCNRSLIREEANGASVIIGEIAHIVGDSRQGPRGRSSLTDTERNKADNLLYLCESCHKLIDKHPMVYSVGVLRQIKRDHEERIKTLSGRTADPPPLPRVSEQLHCTLLRVSALPAHVFAAPCAFTERQERDVASRIIYPKASDECVPFLLRDKKLYSFHDPKISQSPFSTLVDCRKTEAIPILDFAADPEGRRRLSFLLNSAIRRFLARRNLAFDKLHKRFFFKPLEVGRFREETYRTLTGRNSTRSVVWQPKRRATGEFKNHWLHLAVSLSFLELSEREWGFSIRIERHITTDGQTPIAADLVGPKVTRLKAKMRNHAYLSEVQFWRDFLSEAKPRFILNFGAQSCIIDSELVSANINWVGIPDDEREFSNQAYEDDLFSFAGLRTATESSDQFELPLDEEDEDEDE